MSDTENEVVDQVPQRRRLRIRSIIDGQALRRDAIVNPNGLSEAMMEQASLTAHYHTLAAEAARQVDDAKLLLENVEAQVYRVIRDELASSGEKVTEALLERLVARHQRVIDTKKALNEAKQIEAVAKGAVQAMRDRKDMLVQLGSNEREEMKGEIAVRIREVGQTAHQATVASVLARRQGRMTQSDETSPQQTD